MPLGETAFYAVPNPDCLASGYDHYGPKPLHFPLVCQPRIQDPLPFVAR